MEDERTVEQGERRRLTLLFSDLCDYTSLNELIDPEETDQLRRQVERAASEVIQRHGGSIIQYYGDGILAVFGLPIPAEHDVRAALDAALELRALTRTLQTEIELPAGFELRMHFGLHSGLVFTRGGDVLHGRYQLTGDAVNTAARLCAAAARDQILVSQAALSGVEPFYEAELVEEIPLKGKRLSVPAYSVHAHSSVRTRFEASTSRGLTRFVNRHAELARLSEALDQAADGCTRTAAIAAGPGMGKTRVLEEFTRRHASLDVLFFRGTCESYGSVVPLQPLIQILRQVLRVRGGTQPELEPYRELIANVLALETGGAELAVLTAVQRRLSEALCVLLRSLEARLVVLVIDDWQWVDDLSHGVLRGLVRSLPRGLLMLVAAREHNAEDPLLQDTQPIDLSPLRADDSTRVIRSLLPDALDLGLTEGLYRRSGGNPLFLEELCRVLPNELPSGLALDQTSVPNTIHGVIQARLSRLPALEVRLLRIASAIGNDFGTSVLAELVGQLDVQPVLERLVAHDLVREAEEPGTYRFKHGITREVVYESVLLAERKAIHAALAQQLLLRAAASGTAAPHEALAHHNASSGQHAAAAHHAELAGDRAAATSALDRARAQYGTALSELDRLQQNESVKRRWLAVSVKWARAWVYSQAPDQLLVLDRAKRHAQELGDLNTLSDLEQMGAWICYALGEQERAIARCTDGLALAAQANNPKLIAQLTSNLGQSYAAAGEYAQAIELLTRAMELKQQGARGRKGAVPVGYAYALATLATVHADQGEFAEARVELTQALDAVHGSGNAIEASMLALAAMTELWRGAWSECVALCERAARTAERVQGPYVFAISQAMRSYGRFMLQRDPEDLQRLRRAADWLEARGMGLYLSMVYGCAAEASWLVNDRESARDYAARALQRAAHKDPFGEAVAYRIRADLEAHELPQSAAAWASLERADTAAQRRGSRHELASNAWWRARLCQRAGNCSAGRAALEVALREFDALGMSNHLDRAQRDLSALGAA